MPDWTIESKHETAKEIVVEGRYDKEPDTCPHCGTVGELYRHGARVVVVRDAPLWGKPLQVRIERRRYRCRSCGQTFSQPLPDIDDQRDMTSRCLMFIRDQAVKRSFRDIADQIGVDPKTVAAVAQEHFQALEARRVVKAPKYLGIDEVSVLSRPRAIFTDVGQKRVLDLIRSRTQDSVMRWLYHLEGRQAVEAVSIDMWLSYKRAIQAALPNAVVVVDRFHISAMANQALDRVRKRHGQRIGTQGRRRLVRSRWLLLKRDRDLSEEQRFRRDAWLLASPNLKAAYWLKETFLNVWEVKDRTGAERAFDAWLASVTKPMVPYYQPLLTAFGNWRAEVLNWWDHPITAGYTEAMNKTIKNIARSGPRQAFDVIRAKLLLRQGVSPDVRCSSCGGAFSPAEVDHEYLLGKSDQPICRDCNRRFHTPDWLIKK